MIVVSQRHYTNLFLVCVQSHEGTSLPSEMREQMLARYPNAKRVRASDALNYSFSRRSAFPSFSLLFLPRRCSRTRGIFRFYRIMKM